MMVREPHRRRSPESTRRRRRDRRDSREQLYNQNHIPVSIPYHELEPRTEPTDSRALTLFEGALSSSASSSSSTSSSLVNVSRREGGTFGFRSFFSGTGERKHRRRVKKKTGFLKFGNSSSSSVGSDLAYGRGYVDRQRRRSRESTPPRDRAPRKHAGALERPPAHGRKETDEEEILELGRKFAEMARQQNREDLKAAGKTRTSRFAGSSAAISHFPRTASSNLDRGIEFSKPGSHSSSDDSEWESASEDESSSEEYDSGLAYGSAPHLPSEPGRSIVQSATSSYYVDSNLAYGSVPHLPNEPSRPDPRDHEPQYYPDPSRESPTYYRSSVVDPNLFGPVNSLRGHVRTPCGFERVDDSPSNEVRRRNEQSVVQSETDLDGRPMQHLFPVPTSDPTRFDAECGSIVSFHQQDPASRSRPAPVPIQQPKPIVPVPNRVFNSVDADLKYSDHSSGRSFAGAAAAGVAGAAIGAVLSADHKHGHENDDATRDAHDQKRKPKKFDGKDDKRRRVDEIHDDRYEKRRDERESIDAKDDYERERRRNEREMRNQERERRRQEKRTADSYTEREHHYRYKNIQNERPEETQIEARSGEESRTDHSPDTVSYRRLEGPEYAGYPASQGPIDPFQFQVPNDAFPTPHFTPKPPLTPDVVTVDREPDFSRLKSSDYEFPQGRLSRKDSYELELREAREAYDAAQHSTAPVDAAAMTAAISAVVAERRSERASRSAEKDPVQEEANRYYRERELARKIGEDERRSRSNSPERSVIDKYQKQPASEPVVVKEPPESKRRSKKKGPYDGPNADVRFDNIFEHPKELHRFLASGEYSGDFSTSNTTLKDSTAAQGRPMLNIIRPTPVPTPVPTPKPEMSQPEPETTVVQERVVEVEKSPSTPDIVLGPRGEVVPSNPPPKAVSWGENQTKHYVVESPFKEDDTSSGTRVITPAETQRSRSGKKSGWGAVAAAVAGAGTAATILSNSSSSPGSAESPTPKSRRRISKDAEDGSSEPESVGDSYENPPVPGPKPQRRKDAQMPGVFAEDPSFMANIAAGLAGTGFDPNIVIDDPNFHTRDSPPKPSGSSIYRSPFPETVTDLGLDNDGFVPGKFHDTSADEHDISPKSTQTLSKQQREVRGQQRDVERDSGAGKTHPVVFERAPAETARTTSDGEDTESPVQLSKKEQKRRAKASNAETRQDNVAESAAPPQMPRSVELAADDEWEDIPTKKSKKSKKPVVVQGSAKRSQETERVSSPVVEVGPSRIVDDGDTPRKGKMKATHEHDIFDSSARSTPTPQAPRGNYPRAAPADTTPRPEVRHAPRRSQTFDSIPPPPSGTTQEKREWFRRVSEQLKGKQNANDPFIREDSGSRVVESPRELTDSLSDVRSERTAVTAMEDWDAFSQISRPKSKRGSMASGSWFTDSFSDIHERPYASDDEWDPLQRPKQPLRRSSTFDEGRARSASQSTAVPGEPWFGTSHRTRVEPWARSPVRSATIPVIVTEELEKEPAKKSRLARRKTLPAGSAIDAAIEEEDKPPDRGRLGFTREHDTSSVVSGMSRYEDAQSQRSGSLSRLRDLDTGRSTPPIERDRKDPKRPKTSSDKDRKGSAGGSSFFTRFRSSIGLRDEKEKDKDRSSKPDDKNSFLGNADTPGEGVGSPGPAIETRSKATDVPSRKEVHVLPVTPERKLSTEPELDLFDSTIAPREIRPAIDPQYGDLLPLPPSAPGPPMSEIDELPELPASRPETPKHERQVFSFKPTHARRSSALEGNLRQRSHSQSAIPIQFRLGHKSTPSSPSNLKYSPALPPATTPDTGSATKRAWPMSWDSSKEFKPLYLVEKTSQDLVNATISSEELPELPPSEPSEASGPPSRGSPSPEPDRLDQDLQYSGLPRIPPLENWVLERPLLGEPLQIDTSVASGHRDSGSEESTPKAEHRSRSLDEMLGEHIVTPSRRVESAADALPTLPTVHESTGTALSDEPLPDEPNDRRMIGAFPADSPPLSPRKPSQEAEIEPRALEFVEQTTKQESEASFNSRSPTLVSTQRSTGLSDLDTDTPSWRDKIVPAALAVATAFVRSRDVDHTSKDKFAPIPSQPEDVAAIPDEVLRDVPEATEEPESPQTATTVVGLDDSSITSPKKSKGKKVHLAETEEIIQPPADLQVAPVAPSEVEGAAKSEVAREVPESALVEKDVTAEIEAATEESLLTEETIVEKEAPVEQEVAPAKLSKKARKRLLRQQRALEREAKESQPIESTPPALSILAPAHEASTPEPQSTSTVEQEELITEPILETAATEQSVTDITAEYVPTPEAPVVVIPRGDQISAEELVDETPTYKEVIAEQPALDVTMPEAPTSEQPEAKQLEIEETAPYELPSIEITPAEQPPSEEPQQEIVAKVPEEEEPALKQSRADTSPIDEPEISVPEVAKTLAEQSPVPAETEDVHQEETRDQFAKEYTTVAKDLPSDGEQAKAELPEQTAEIFTSESKKEKRRKKKKGRKSTSVDHITAAASGSESSFADILLAESIAGLSDLAPADKQVEIAEETAQELPAAAQPEAVLQDSPRPAYIIDRSLDEDKPVENVVLLETATLPQVKDSAAHDLPTPEPLPTDDTPSPTSNKEESKDKKAQAEELEPVADIPGKLESEKQYLAQLGDDVHDRDAIAGAEVSTPGGGPKAESSEALSQLKEDYSADKIKDIDQPHIWFEDSVPTPVLLEESSRDVGISPESVSLTTTPHKAPMQDTSITASEYAVDSVPEQTVLPIRVSSPKESTAGLVPLLDEGDAASESNAVGEISAPAETALSIHENRGSVEAESPEDATNIHVEASPSSPTPPTPPTHPLQPNDVSGGEPESQPDPALSDPLQDPLPTAGPIEPQASSARLNKAVETSVVPGSVPPEDTSIFPGRHIVEYQERAEAKSGTAVTSPPATRSGPSNELEPVRSLESSNPQVTESQDVSADTKMPSRTVPSTDVGNAGDVRSKPASSAEEPKKAKRNARQASRILGLLDIKSAFSRPAFGAGAPSTPKAEVEAPQVQPPAEPPVDNVTSEPALVEEKPTVIAADIQPLPSSPPPAEPIVEPQPADPVEHVAEPEVIGSERVDQPEPPREQTEQTVADLPPDPATPTKKSKKKGKKSRQSAEVDDEASTPKPIEEDSKPIEEITQLQEEGRVDESASVVTIPQVDPERSLLGATERGSLGDEQQGDDRPEELPIVEERFKDDQITPEQVQVGQNDDEVVAEAPEPDLVEHKVPVESTVTTEPPVDTVVEDASQLPENKDLEPESIPIPETPPEIGIGSTVAEPAEVKDEAPISHDLQAKDAPESSTAPEERVLDQDSNATSAPSDGKKSRKSKKRLSVAFADPIQIIENVPRGVDSEDPGVKAPPPEPSQDLGVNDNDSSDTPLLNGYSAEVPAGDAPSDVLEPTSRLIIETAQSDEGSNQQVLDPSAIQLPDSPVEPDEELSQQIPEPSSIPLPDSPIVSRPEVIPETAQPDEELDLRVSEPTQLPEAPAVSQEEVSYEQDQSQEQATPSKDEPVEEFLSEQDIPETEAPQTTDSLEPENVAAPDVPEITPTSLSDEVAPVEPSQPDQTPPTEDVTPSTPIEEPPVTGKKSKKSKKKRKSKEQNSLEPAPAATTSTDEIGPQSETAEAPPAAPADDNEKTADLTDDAITTQSEQLASDTQLVQDAGAPEDDKSKDKTLSVDSTTPEPEAVAAPEEASAEVDVVAPESAADPETAAVPETNTTVEVVTSTERALLPELDTSSYLAAGHGPGAPEPALEPASSEPVSLESVPSEQVISESISPEPVDSEPVISEPVTLEPVTLEPVASEPFTSEPVISEPVISEPVAVELVTEPDTAFSNEESLPQASPSTNVLTTATEEQASPEENPPLDEEAPQVSSKKSKKDKKKRRKASQVDEAESAASAAPIEQTSSGQPRSLNPETTSVPIMESPTPLPEITEPREQTLESSKDISEAPVESRTGEAEVPIKQSDPDEADPTTLTEVKTSESAAASVEPQPPLQPVQQEIDTALENVAQSVAEQPPTEPVDDIATEKPTEQSSEQAIEQPIEEPTENPPDDHMEQPLEQPIEPYVEELMKESVRGLPEVEATNEQPEPVTQFQDDSLVEQPTLENVLQEQAQPAANQVQTEHIAEITVPEQEAPTETPVGEIQPSPSETKSKKKKNKKRAGQGIAEASSFTPGDETPALPTGTEPPAIGVEGPVSSSPCQDVTTEPKDISVEDNGDISVTEAKTESLKPDDTYLGNDDTSVNAKDALPEPTETSHETDDPLVTEPNEASLAQEDIAPGYQDTLVVQDAILAEAKDILPEQQDPAHKPEDATPAEAKDVLSAEKEISPGLKDAVSQEPSILPAQEPRIDPTPVTPTKKSKKARQRERAKARELAAQREKQASAEASQAPDITNEVEAGASPAPERPIETEVADKGLEDTKSEQSGLLPEAAPNAEQSIAVQEVTSAPEIERQAEEPNTPAFVESSRKEETPEIASAPETKNKGTHQDSVDIVESEITKDPASEPTSEPIQDLALQYNPSEETPKDVSAEIPGAFPEEPIQEPPQVYIQEAVREASPELVPEAPQEPTQENRETTPETVPQAVLDTSTEAVQKPVQEGQDINPEPIPEAFQDPVQETVTGDVSEAMEETFPEVIPEALSQDIPETATVQPSKPPQDAVPESVPAALPEFVNDAIPDTASEPVDSTVPDIGQEGVSGLVSEPARAPTLAIDLVSATEPSHEVTQEAALEADPQFAAQPLEEQQSEKAASDPVQRGVTEAAEDPVQEEPIHETPEKIQGPSQDTDAIDSAVIEASNAEPDVPLSQMPEDEYSKEPTSHEESVHEESAQESSIVTTALGNSEQPGTEVVGPPSTPKDETLNDVVSTELAMKEGIADQVTVPGNEPLTQTESSQEPAGNETASRSINPVEPDPMALPDSATIADAAKPVSTKKNKKKDKKKRRKNISVSEPDPASIPLPEAEDGPLEPDAPTTTENLDIPEPSTSKSPLSSDKLEAVSAAQSGEDAKKPHAPQPPEAVIEPLLHDTNMRPEDTESLPPVSETTVHGTPVEATSETLEVNSQKFPDVKSQTQTKRSSPEPEEKPSGGQDVPLPQEPGAHVPEMQDVSVTQEPTSTEQPLAAVDKPELEPDVVPKKNSKTNKNQKRASQADWEPEPGASAAQLHPTVEILIPTEDTLRRPADRLVTEDFVGPVEESGKLSEVPPVPYPSREPRTQSHEAEREMSLVTEPGSQVEREREPESELETIPTVEIAAEELPVEPPLQEAFPVDQASQQPDSHSATDEAPAISKDMEFSADVESDPFSPNNSKVEQMEWEIRRDSKMQSEFPLPSSDLGEATVVNRASNTETPPSEIPIVEMPAVEVTSVESPVLETPTADAPAESLSSVTPALETPVAKDYIAENAAERVHPELSPREVPVADTTSEAPAPEIPFTDHAVPDMPAVVAPTQEEAEEIDSHPVPEEPPATVEDTEVSGKPVADISRETSKDSEQERKEPPSAEDILTKQQVLPDLLPSIGLTGLMEPSSIPLPESEPEDEVPSIPGAFTGPAIIVPIQNQLAEAHSALREDRQAHQVNEEAGKEKSTGPAVFAENLPISDEKPEVSLGQAPRDGNETRKTPIQDSAERSQDKRPDEHASKKSRKERRKGKKAQPLGSFEPESPPRLRSQLQSTQDLLAKSPENDYSKAASPSEITRPSEPKNKPSVDSTSSSARKPPSNPSSSLEELEREAEPDLFPVTRKLSKRRKKQLNAQSETASPSDGVGTPAQVAEPDNRPSMGPTAPASTTTPREPVSAMTREENFKLELASRMQEHEFGNKLHGGVAETVLSEISQMPEPLAETVLSGISQVYDVTAPTPQESAARSAASQPDSEEISNVGRSTSKAKDVWDQDRFFKPRDTATETKPMSEDQQKATRQHRSPSPNRSLLDKIDLSPAQLSSHIQHDRPFDQSTQPGKKIKTDLARDIFDSAESPATQDITQERPVHEGDGGLLPGATIIPKTNVSSPKPSSIVTQGHAEATRPLESENQASEYPSLTTHPRDIAISYLESQILTNTEAITRKKATPVQTEPTSQGTHGELSMSSRELAASMMESHLGKTDKKNRGSASWDHPEDIMAAESISSDEKPTSLQEDTVEMDLDKAEKGLATNINEPQSDQKRKDNQFKFPPSDEADIKETRELEKKPSEGDVQRTGEEGELESPVIGQPVLVPTDVKERPGVSTEQSATNFIKDLDKLDTSEHAESRDYKAPNPAEAETRQEIPRQEPITPPRPRRSIVEFNRVATPTLPSVAEEPHEESQESEEPKIGGSSNAKSRTVEMDRDSGFVTESPYPGRRSYDPSDYDRDSGVHLRDWVEHTAGKQEGVSEIKTPRTPAPAPATATPATPTRAPTSTVEGPRSKTLLSSETPNLKTAAQDESPKVQGPRRSPNPTEPPISRASSKYPGLATGTAVATGAPLRTVSPQTQAQGTRSASDNMSRRNIPLAERQIRRSLSGASLARRRTPEPLNSGFRPDSPSSNPPRGSFRSGTNTPPLSLRRVGRIGTSGSIGGGGGVGDMDSPSPSHSPRPSHMYNNSHSNLYTSHTNHTNHPISNRSTSRVSTNSTTNIGSNLSTARNRESERDGEQNGEQHHDKEVQPRERRATPNTTPIANEGRVRAKEMADVYDGYGEGRMGSPRSPTRPQSMRRRQSMQVLELESKVEALLAENRVLSDARAQAESNQSNVNSRAASAIADRDAEIEALKASVSSLHGEISRLREVNDGLNSANNLLALQHNEKYSRLESKHAILARELEEHRDTQGNYSKTLQEKDIEIERLRDQLEASKDLVRELQKQILDNKPPDAEFLRLKDEDYFDHRCQQLCSHVQQWVLRFSKFSDMRASRLTSEINDEKIIDRLDNTILDGSDVDDYLKDRVRRRDVFMSMTMNMVWEFVFTRYLFGMDREQRQKLKSLEKLLSDVGPLHAVRQWRAVTLTLLSKRPAFGDQRNQDTEAVVQAILQTLSMILPPPSNMEDQIQSQLRRVMREAVDLSIEMRTQRAEYMMLPPLQPEYDANGDLVQTVTFNASLMNERSNGPISNEDLEAQGAIVRTVLFPLVVKKGEDNGVGDEEIVVCPAQVLVAKPRHSTNRIVTPSSDAGGMPLSRGATPSSRGHTPLSQSQRGATPLSPRTTPSALAQSNVSMRDV